MNETELELYEWKLGSGLPMGGFGSRSFQKPCLKRVRFLDLAVLEKYTGLWKYFQTLLMMEGFLHHLQNNIENPKMPMKYKTLFIVRINDRYTPLKLNMEPENQPLEKEIPFGNHHFQIPCLTLGAYTDIPWTSLMKRKPCGWVYTHNLPSLSDSYRMILHVGVILQLPPCLSIFHLESMYGIFTFVLMVVFCFCMVDSR